MAGNAGKYMLLASPENVAATDESKTSDHFCRFVNVLYGLSAISVDDLTL